MPRATHLSDSSYNASEVESEDDVDIVAPSSTSAKSSAPSSRANSKQTRKAKARSSVSTQPAKVGCKPNAFRILGVSKPQGKALTKGRGSLGSASSGIWYHDHWSPVDKETYPGCVRTDTDLRKRLCKDNAKMQCKHCFMVRRFQPTTYFKGHLLSGCPNFQATEAWMSKDVQDEVSKNVTQVCLSVVAFA
jgi:hypothetical protein